MKIVIVGGGNLGHALLGILGVSHDIILKTRSPLKWKDALEVKYPNRGSYMLLGFKVSDDPEEIYDKADVIILTVPGYAIESELSQIKQYANPKIPIISVFSSTGIFQIADSLHMMNPVIGFERVPYICRIENYGSAVSILGTKPLHRVGFLGIRDYKVTVLMKKIFENENFHFIPDWRSVAYVNSNALLHTANVYHIGLKEYDHQLKFYCEYSLEAAEDYISMDQELHEMLKVIGVEEKVPSVLSYYEVEDASSLQEKLRSIPAFKSIDYPMIKSETGYTADIQSRYFLEDFNYSLYYLHQLSIITGVKAPTINRIYDWGINAITENNSEMV